MTDLRAGSGIGSIPLRLWWPWASSLATCSSGATYLIVKTEGDLQSDCYGYARTAAGWLLAAAVVAGGWAYAASPFLARTWFVWPGALFTTLPTCLGGVAFILLIRSLKKRREPAPFVWSLVLFSLLMFATAASVYPYVVPPNLTLTAAAAPTLTLTVMLILIAVLLPVMLIYNGYQYRVFKGKTPDRGYGGYEE